MPDTAAAANAGSNSSIGIGLGPIQREHRQSDRRSERQTAATETTVGQYQAANARSLGNFVQARVEESQAVGESVVAGVQILGDSYAIATTPFAVKGLVGKVVAGRTAAATAVGETAAAETAAAETVAAETEGAAAETAATEGARLAPSSTKAEHLADWVDEGGNLRTGGNPGMRPDAYEFQSGAPGARSNVLTREPQAPYLEFTDETGNVVGAKFDGLQGSELIDRKLNPVFSAKAVDQATRQSAVAQHYGLQAVWELPNQQALDVANRFLQSKSITGITTRLAP